MNPDFSSYARFKATTIGHGVANAEGTYNAYQGANLVYQHFGRTMAVSRSYGFSEAPDTTWFSRPNREKNSEPPFSLVEGNLGSFKVGDIIVMLYSTTQRFLQYGGWVGFIDQIISDSEVIIYGQGINQQSDLFHTGRVSGSLIPYISGGFRPPWGDTPDPPEPPEPPIPPTPVIPLVSKRNKSNIVILHRSRNKL